jgi:hypothetical protein
VEISRAFYLGVHEVTQGQFEKVDGLQPQLLLGPRRGDRQIGPDAGQDQDTGPAADSRHRIPLRCHTSFPKQRRDIFIRTIRATA